MRVAILSDIHSNLAALQAVLAELPPFDEVWCLGDIVGYGPDPNECVEAVFSLPHLAIAGNHDWAAVGKVDTAEFNTDARRAAEWTGQRLTPANRNLLAALPTESVVGDFTLAHGSPREPIWEYILGAGQAAANLPYFATPYCLVGHTHVPAIFLAPTAGERAAARRPQPGDRLEYGDRRFIANPGGVGQPRDGDPRAAYGFLDTVERTLTFRRVAYPVEVTQEKMRQVGLPNSLWQRLSFGW
ncbi:MAG: metallophosphatase family protein [Chloroflexi bacterium]|nr:metallophosphatase family protein [Chloroflexota bacterium]MCL5110544.1 metallophosphatase family protein [Chloroflexota bacterium]